MNQKYYYIATGASICLITFIASSIKQVYLVIDFVGVCGIIFVSYIQPSIFYLVASYRSIDEYAKERLNNPGFNEEVEPTPMKPRNNKLIVSAIFELTLGIIMFVTGIIGWIIEVNEFSNEELV